jgi:spermidine synthase
MPSESSRFVPPRVLIGVALMSGALLMTELSLTRIFSVTMYYHFAFMAISIALFGLSASGVYVFLLRERFSRIPIERLLVTHALAYATSTVVSLAVLVRLHIGLTSTPTNIALMAATYLLAALPFFAGGAAISIAIARLSASVNAIYGADLLGAAGACLLLLPTLNRLGAPGAIVTAALLGAVAAVLFAPPGFRSGSSARALSLAAVVVIGAVPPLNLFTVSTTKGHENHPVLFSKWNSFSRIGVYDQPYGAWSLSDRYTGPLPDTHLMDIDSAAGTQILRFSGDLRDVEYLQYELTAIGYRLFSAPGAPSVHSEPETRAATPFRALVIGPGGGRDLLSALVFGASSVDGVEINPIIANDVMRGRFRDYSGGIYDHPAVHIHVEDGRSFVRRSSDQYDVIQASLVDTWAATAAGAYTLTENSLYTVEAFDDYLDHLSDRGILSISRWVFDGLRLISLAQEACARHGWSAADRLAVIQYDKVATFLLKKTPFTPAERDQLAATARDLNFEVLYLPGVQPAVRGDTRDDYARLILAADRAGFYRAYPLDVTPTTDDRPFFFHTTKLRSQRFVAAILRWFGQPVEARPADGSWGTGGLTALLVLLLISCGLVVAFIIGPLAMTARSALAPGWRQVLAYFACLGGGFMLLEVALLQRFVLLLGHPVYSLTVTLLSLLLGTGIGSLVSRRIPDASLPRAAALACMGIALIGLLWASVLPGVIRLTIGWPLPLRLLTAALLMAPAGMLMGVPLPAGVRLLAATRPQLIPWAWGINGALSVLGATLAVFIAMNWGFSATLVCGGMLYAGASALTRSSGRMLPSTAPAAVNAPYTAR